MDDSGVEMLKEIPGFKAILKAVLRQQIQMLVQQLSDHVGEEAVLLTCSISDCSLGHLGSDTGKTFLKENHQIKSQFLGYCLKKHERKTSEESSNLQSPSEAPNTQPTPHPGRPTLQFNPKTISLVKRRSYSIKRPTPYTKLCSTSKRQKATENTDTTDSVSTRPDIKNEHQSDCSSMIAKLNEDCEELPDEQSNDTEQMFIMNNTVNVLKSSGVNEISQSEVGISSTNVSIGPTNAIKDNNTIVAGENNQIFADENITATLTVKKEDGVSDAHFGTSTLEESASEMTNQEASEMASEEPADGSTANGEFQMILVKLNEKKQRRILSLEERVNALNLMSSGLSARKTALSFGVGKSQIQHIFKHREEIMADWLSGNFDPDRKRRGRKTENDEINAMCLDWYNQAVASGYQVSGPALQQKALELAVQLGVPSFKASNGWLESFRKRYKVVTSGQKVSGSGEKKSKAVGSESQCVEKLHFDDSVVLVENDSQSENSYINEQIERAITETEHHENMSV